MVTARQVDHPLENGPANLSPMLSEAFAFWQRLRGDRFAPSRRELDPIEMRNFLAHILLIDVVGANGPTTPAATNEGDTLRFRYRLAGTASNAIHGMELTGVFIDELSPQSFVDNLTQALVRLVETREPHFVRWSFENRDGNWREFSALRMPLSSDGETVDVIFVVADYGNAPLDVLSRDFTAQMSG